MRLEDFNCLDPARAEEELMRVCHSRRFASEMTAARPYPSLEAAFQLAEKVWARLSPADWAEAFQGHPRIGERALREKFAATAAWSSEEQKGMKGASDSVVQSLVEGNRAYEARFGHIFLVCATGKGADEMLAELRSRMKNDPQTELRVASAEQAKITRIRMERLLTPE